MILDQINEQIIKEYKGGDAEKRVLLQTIKAALLNKSKEKGDSYNNQDEVQVLKSELKQREEALEQFKAGGREDLVSKTTKEIEIIKNYLPEELSETQIEEVVKSKLNDLDDKSFGSVMKAVMAELKGRADGAKVAQIVRKSTET
ncbi:MAG: GatB/YqeY domain-containing protein [Candidatus Berkelbacteria bacterium]|nr:GatB/YqeY domain-containing protein [Candidatus Berkelbacteria bacterium]